jgi:hypothetical protein
MIARFALGIATISLAVTASVASPLRAETPCGGVYVTTLPSGANVWIDGTFVGRAPVLVDALLPGHHAVTLTKSGWTAQEVDVSINPREIAMSSTRLAEAPQPDPGAGPGSVLVRGAPPGATLSLDGGSAANVGKTQNVPPGPHQITMTTPRGRTTRKFVVLPNTTTEVVLEEPQAGGDAHSAVVAPAEDYLPTDAFSVAGKKIVVRYAGHLAVAHFGEADIRLDGATVTFDAAPQQIAGKLYLPLELLQQLTGDTSKDR